MGLSDYYVSSITSSKYERAVASAIRLFLYIKDSEEVYVGRGVHVTKSGDCSVKVIK